MCIAVGFGIGSIHPLGEDNGCLLVKHGMAWLYT